MLSHSVRVAAKAPSYAEGVWNQELLIRVAIAVAGRRRVARCVQH